MMKNDFTSGIGNRYVKSSSSNTPIGAEPNGDVGIANVGEWLGRRIPAVRYYRNLYKN